jgi:hypothetical protein
MLNQTSKEFRALFLLKFIQEVLKNTKTYQEVKKQAYVRNIIEEKEEKRKEEPKNIIFPTQKKDIRNIIKERERREKSVVSQLKRKELRPLPRPIPRLMRRPVLRIPEPRLPLTVQYLRPTPTTREMDLEKLNPLINDPLVKIIECNGPGENIMVTGSMGRKMTNIVLTKEDIDLTIQRFSEATKIPVHEGIFKVVRGRLIFSAIISNIIGSKFLIKKMPYYSKVRAY